jgi:hypothetical protein
MTHVSLLILKTFCLMELPVFRASAIRYYYGQKIRTTDYCSIVVSIPASHLRGSWF